MSKFNIENKTSEKPPKKHTQRYLMGFPRTHLLKDSQGLSKKNLEVIEFKIDQLRMLMYTKNLTLIVLGQEAFLCTGLMQGC